MRQTRLAAMVCVAAALAMAPVPAQAASITLDASHEVVRGASVDFNATLTMSLGDADPLYLNGIAISLSGPGLTTSDSPFFISWPFQLDSTNPGVTDTFNGPLFTVFADLTAVPPGPYLGSVSLILGSSPTDLSLDITRPFEVTVQGAPPVPEPGTIGLLGLGLATFAMRRRMA